MPSTATLRRRRHASFCYLWLIDGVEMAFTDNPILEFGDYTGSGHDIRTYLEPDGMKVEEALDLRSGRLDEVTSTFVLVDLDGDLATLFAAEAEDEEPLVQSVYPSDNLLARTELHGMHVGTECIGPAGERAQFPCVPGWQVGGMHIGLDQELPQHRPAPVTSTPIVWAGRRCCLYRCYIDSDGTRRPFAEAERLWWGTMRDQGSVDGRRWSLDVAGPQSWLQRDLGVLTQRDPAVALGALTLSDAPGQDETRIGISFRRRGIYDGAVNEAYAVREFIGTITGDTQADIIASISAELNVAQAAAGDDGAFNVAQNRYVSIDALGRFTIHIDEDPADEAAAEMLLSLHGKIWRAIGYDPPRQNGASDATFIYFAGYGGSAEGLSPGVTPHGSAPGAGYIYGVFNTIATDDESNGDNDGAPRQYRPLYEGGVTVLLANLNDGEGQIVDLDNGLGGSSIYHRGQLSRPIASDPNSPTDPYDIVGVGDCNRQGLWLFYGKRRFASGAEVDEYQVARASWVSGALQQQGLVQGSRIVVTEWLHPRTFGYDRDRMTTDWVARANSEGEYRVRAVPILALDYRSAGALERAHVVIERLLRSTGTSSGWDGYELDPGADLVPGVNNSAGTPPRDAEVEDLGLAIPGEMVADVLAFGLEGDALPGELGDVKVSFSPGMASDELLEGLMRPFGWCWTLRGGRYGFFTPTRQPAPALVDVVLDGSTKLGTGGEGGISQDLRAFAPIDRFELQYNYAAHLGKFGKTYGTDSKDTGRRYRSGGIVERQSGHGIRGLSGWATKARDMGTWWNRRHFFVRGWPYMDREPRHVGEYVRISDPRGFDPAGVYGLDEMLGVITRVACPLRPGAREPFAELDVLVYAGSSGTPRLHAFAGRALGIDTDQGLLYVRDNWLGIPHPDWPGDASRFIEVPFPGLAAIGGEADIVIVQWDGSAWRPPITGYFVRGAGVDGVGANLSLSGTPPDYFHKMDTIVLLAPRGSQTADWVLDRYGVICNKLRTFDGGTQGFRWEDL